MNETKFADSSEEESFGRFAQYIDYPKKMPFPNMRFECGGPGFLSTSRAGRLDDGRPIVLLEQNHDRNYQFSVLYAATRARSTTSSTIRRA